MECGLARRERPRKPTAGPEHPGCELRRHPGNRMAFCFGMEGPFETRGFTFLRTSCQLSVPGSQLNSLFAETSQSEQSAVVGVRPGMTAVDADVILEAVGGGEDGSGQDADVFRQGRAIES